MPRTKKVTSRKKTANRKKLRKQSTVRKQPTSKKAHSVVAVKVTSPEPVSLDVTLPPKTRKKRGTNPTRMYFTQETEDAIVAYNLEPDVDKREIIFREKIHQPFQKLVENVFNTFKFSYFETGPQDAQKECLTHLVANMHKFDPNRQSKLNPNMKAKAFAYFSIIAKHYLILLNNTNHKKFNQNVEISEDREENTIQLQQDDKYYAQQEMSDFIRLVIEFWEKNVNKIFSKQRDLNIANAVVELFRNSERIDAFNKKALYLYIREMAMCKTQQITKVINRMKQYQDNLQKSYIEDGSFSTERTSG